MKVIMQQKDRVEEASEGSGEDDPDSQFAPEEAPAIFPSDQGRGKISALAWKRSGEGRKEALSRLGSGIYVHTHRRGAAPDRMPAGAASFSGQSAL
jgi:hypothetical protein